MKCCDWLPYHGVDGSAGDTEKRWIRCFHLLGVVAGLATGLCLLVLGLVQTQDYYISWVTRWPQPAPPYDTSHRIDTMATLNPLFIIVIPLLWSVISQHLLIGCNLWGILDTLYTDNANLYRWIDRFFSLSIQRILLLMLLGIDEFYYCYTLFLLSQISIIALALCEFTMRDSDTKKRSRWLFWSLGIGLSFLQIMGILISLFIHNALATQPPNWYYAMISIPIALELIDMLFSSLHLEDIIPFAPTEIIHTICEIAQQQSFAWLLYGGSRTFT